MQRLPVPVAPTSCAVEDKLVILQWKEIVRVGINEYAANEPVIRREQCYAMRWSIQHPQRITRAEASRRGHPEFTRSLPHASQCLEETTAGVKQRHGTKVVQRNRPPLCHEKFVRRPASRPSAPEG